jgi:hypothetical protein
MLLYPPRATHRAMGAVGVPRKGDHTMVDSDGLEWRRSSYSGPSSYVEVAISADHVYVRKSSEPEVRLVFSHEEWRAFVGGLGDRRLDGEWDGHR